MSWFGSESGSTSGFEENAPSVGLETGGSANQDLQEFIMAEKQRQQITQTVSIINLYQLEMFSKTFCGL